MTCCLLTVADLTKVFHFITSAKSATRARLMRQALQPDSLSYTPSTLELAGCFSFHATSWLPVSQHDVKLGQHALG